MFVRGFTRGQAKEERPREMTRYHVGTFAPPPRTALVVFFLLYWVMAMEGVLNGTYAVQRQQCEPGFRALVVQETIKGREVYLQFVRTILTNERRLIEERNNKAAMCAV